MVLPFVAPLGYVCASAGPEETKNQRGKEGLRLIQIRLTTPSLAKISPTCQTNSPQSANHRFEFDKRGQLFLR
jgi:hypothetical protein